MELTHYQRKKIDKYLDKRFPYADQSQIKHNWRNELKLFIEFCNKENAESSRNEKTFKNSS